MMLTRSLNLPFFAAATLTLTAFGCGDDDSECPAGTMAVEDGCVEVADGGPRLDAQTPDMPDAARPDCEPTSDTDPLDPEGLDENCDGVDGVAIDLIFVSALGGNDSNSGTPTNPLKTIERAVELAGDRTIVLDEGPFSTRLELEGSLSIHGGYVYAEGRGSRAEKSNLNAILEVVEEVSF